MKTLLNMAFGGDDNNRLQIEGNIFYNRTAGDCVYQFWNWSPTRVAFCDHNLPASAELPRARAK